jgi:hypothetical protein
MSQVIGSPVIGWDIGGANVKAAHVALRGERPSVQTISRPFEIWKAKDALPEVLQGIAADLPPARATAVTMTAELSDAFRTKREGVGFVLDAVRRVPTPSIRVFTTAGAFVDEATARACPLAVAASNWMATAQLVARHVSDALVIDVGSTTTDVTLVRAGRVVAAGRTDPERLVAGELVYTGVVRTNVAAIVPRVPFGGRPCPVASEYFAVSGDVYVLLGDLDPAAYTAPTPDGRAPTEPFAAERLARVVCADVDMLGRDEILTMARAVADAQVDQIALAIGRAAERTGGAVEGLVTGLGAFLGHRACARAGVRSRELSEALGVHVGLAAPAVAVAWLLAVER